MQVSQGQQILPKPTLGAARQIGNVVRRAKQYKTLTWKILPIPFDQLRLCVHTDAAFANAKKQGTQAGYLVGVTTDELQEGKPAPWSPYVWKSYRLRRVVGSTFAGESQVLSDGLGHAEWIACHLAEVKHGNFSLATHKTYLHEFKLQAIVDCKSIYDHLQNYASPASVGDKRVAIDLIIIKEALQRVGGVIRWSPTWLQLADALTKESVEAMDLLRAAMTTNMYHLNDESKMMEAAAEQRQVRLNRKTDAEKSQECLEPFAESQTSEVRFVRCRPEFSMVKVSTQTLSEEEVRSLFECLVSGWVKSGDDFLENMTQSKSMCRARAPASVVDSKQFRAETSLVTFTYTKTTKMVRIQGQAVLLDKSEEMLKKVIHAYEKLIKDGEVCPLPEGSQACGKAIKDSYDQGLVSHFMDEMRMSGEGEDSKSKLIEVKKQTLVPEDEEFTAAVAELCSEGARKLHHFPAWRNKYLQFMLREFNASTDQVLELSDLTDKMNDPNEDTASWQMEDGTDLCDAKPKARAGGYRSQVNDRQAKKEF